MSNVMTRMSSSHLPNKKMSSSKRTWVRWGREGGKLRPSPRCSHPWRARQRTRERTTANTKPPSGLSCLTPLLANLIRREPVCPETQLTPKQLASNKIRNFGPTRAFQKIEKDLVVIETVKPFCHLKLDNSKALGLFQAFFTNHHHREYHFRSLMMAPKAILVVGKPVFQGSFHKAHESFDISLWIGHQGNRAEILDFANALLFSKQTSKDTSPRRRFSRGLFRIIIGRVNCWAKTKKAA